MAMGRGVPKTIGLPGRKGMRGLFHQWAPGRGDAGRGLLVPLAYGRATTFNL